MAAQVCLTRSRSCSCDVLFVVCYTVMLLLLPSTLFNCALLIRYKDVILRRREIYDTGESDRCFADESRWWVKITNSANFLQTFRETYRSHLQAYLSPQCNNLQKRPHFSSTWRRELEITQRNWVIPEVLKKCSVFIFMGQTNQGWKVG
jgi:hypothetical protein